MAAYPLLLDGLNKGFRMGSLVFLITLLFILLLAAVASLEAERARRRKPCAEDQRQRLRQLRESALQCPSISQRSGARNVLTDWNFALSPLGAWTDPDAQEVRMSLVDEQGDFYDDTTLLLVLLHETAHAVAGPHGPPWEDEHHALLQAATIDGLLPAGAEPDSDYPAEILEDP